MKNQYSDIVKGLNYYQKQAASSIEGPIIVIAGPGTGKTHVLSTRIATILKKTDTLPSSILALTYTDSASVTMRKRVVSLIGKAGYYVHIYTFHSFCNEIIRTNPEYFTVDKNSNPITKLEQYSLIEEILDKEKIKLLRPFGRPYMHSGQILSAISSLKKEGILPDQFYSLIQNEEIDYKKLSNTQKLLFEKRKEKNLELCMLYKAYEEKKKKINTYDFDDMISYVLLGFTQYPDLIAQYQEKYQYVLVDEYQDTNTAQNTIVFNLVSYWGQNANIFVVGDPNQSIYRFQGASFENIIEFINTYKKATVITLAENYRNPQSICDCSYRLICNNKDNTKLESNNVIIENSYKRLKSNQKEQKNSIQIRYYPSQITQLVSIAKDIKILLQKKVAAENIAILFRNNFEAEELCMVLDKWGISYEMDSGENVLKNEIIRQLLKLFSVIHQLQSEVDSEDLFEVLSYEYLNLPSVAVLKLVVCAGKKRQNLYEFLENISNKDSTLKDVSPIELEAIKRFISTLQKWVIQDKQVVFTAWFETIIKESGFLDYILSKENKIELVTALNALFSQIKQFVKNNHNFKLSDFLQVISTMHEKKIEIYAEDLNIVEKAIHISTVHKAKGREWDYVYVINCIDGRWGNARTRNLFNFPSGVLKYSKLSKLEHNEDERRLFYVALTRSKKRFIACVPETLIIDNKTKPTVASMFIEEMKSKHVLEKHILIYESEVLDTYTKLLSPAKSFMKSYDEKAFFTSLIEKFKLSVTSLNKYLRDTDDFIINVLLKVPRAKSPHMAFGTAIHTALEFLYQEYKKKNYYPNKHKVFDTYQKALKQESLAKRDFDERLDYGQMVLEKYYDEKKHYNFSIAAVEKTFGYYGQKIMFGNIPLTGKIDRIDFIDKQLKKVHVIDYKTGTVLSENQILGKTNSEKLSERELSLPETIKGSYMRQLLFYKLLIQLDTTMYWTVETGEFEFVESIHKRNKYISRTFELNNQDIVLLKQLIYQVMSEIRSLSFLK